jgi:4-aminobutyrate aminotransferase-like enzyme
LTDVEGHKYIDLTAQWATNNIGNIEPSVTDIAIQGLRRYGFLIPFISPHKPLFDLAEKLLQIAPCKRLTRVSYEATGTGAVEAAVKLAISSKQRPLLLSFIGEYHGFSLGGINYGSVSSETRWYFESFQGGVIFAPYPNTYRQPPSMTPEEWADWILYDYIEDTLLNYIADHDRIAGVLFEPIIAEAGIWVPPDNFIYGLRKLADKHDWFLICDEVESGFARTGKMFAIEHWGIDVDLIPMAKGLSGGTIPIGAILGSDEAMASDTSVGTTFGGHPAACMAAIATIDYMLKNRLNERAMRLGEKALARMKEWKDHFEIVGDCRGRGLLLGAEIVTDKRTKTRDPTRAEAIFRECVRNGVLPLMSAGDCVIRVEPPLNIDDELLEKALDVMEAAISTVSKS